MIFVEKFLLLLYGCVWWNSSRANPRERDKHARWMSEQNGLTADYNAIDHFARKSAAKTSNFMQPTVLADYDIIEVINNGSASDYTDEEVGFSAVKERFCSSDCVRGLSGLCICPLSDTLPRATTLITTDLSLMTASSSRPPTPAGRQTALHWPVTAGRTNKKSPSNFTPSFHSDEDPNWPAMMMMGSRVKRGDDDDEEDQKLCKCRRCRKLFKRTLYCRVFPCYQKKCKSGEWKSTDRESTPSSAAAH